MVCNMKKFFLMASAFAISISAFASPGAIAPLKIGSISVSSNNQDWLYENVIQDASIKQYIHNNNSTFFVQNKEQVGDTVKFTFPEGAYSFDGNANNSSFSADMINNIIPIGNPYPIILLERSKNSLGLPLPYYRVRELVQGTYSFLESSLFPFLSDNNLDGKFTVTLSHGDNPIGAYSITYKTNGEIKADATGFCDVEQFDPTDLSKTRIYCDHLEPNAEPISINARITTTKPDLN